MSRDEEAPRPSAGELSSPLGKEGEPTRGPVKKSKGVLDTKKNLFQEGRVTRWVQRCTQRRKKVGGGREQTW